MMGFMRTRLLRSALPASLVSLLAVALLAGCVPQSKGTAEQPTPATLATSTASATPTPTPTASASDVDGIPMSIPCTELITPQAMYDYNPNFGLEAGHQPVSGSLAAAVLKQNGVACSWINQTSGQRIEIAVAKLPEAHSTALKNELVTTSHSVPTYRVEGYFTLNGSVGEAQAFPDPYWVVATSTAFFEPGDVAPLMASAIKALG